MREPLEQYLDAFDEYRGTVEDLLEATVDLSQLADLAVDVVSDPAFQEALRYLAGPPISQADLKTLADVESLAASRIRADPEIARRIVETVLLGLDRRRFSWVAEGREPAPAEREAAALASAALWASQRISTNRRMEGKAEQEAAVRDRLTEAGFEEVSARPIRNLSEAPGPGEFCRETIFGSRKADLVVALWDGRKMPLECKVSGSELNSIKRLNNDAAVKAETWLREFGSLSVVSAAVLAGVFKRRHLIYAQERGLTLWWAHKLDALAEWVEETRP